MTKEQRLHREQDPRVRRSLAKTLVYSTLLVVVALSVVGLRVQQVHLAYRMDALRAEHSRVERQLRELEVEMATLRSPGRLESRARQLGLGAPSPSQIRMAREYVGGGAGLAVVGAARTEALVR